MMSEKCPYKVGDRVVYKPTPEGRGRDIMTDDEQLMIPGNKYVIARIDNEVYVVVHGHEDAIEGGIYWTEFAPA